MKILCKKTHYKQQFLEKHRIKKGEFYDFSEDTIFNYCKIYKDDDILFYDYKQYIDKFYTPEETIKYIRIQKLNKLNEKENC